VVNSVVPRLPGSPNCWLTSVRDGDSNVDSLKHATPQRSSGRPGAGSYGPAPRPRGPGRRCAEGPARRVDEWAGVAATISDHRRLGPDRLQMLLQSLHTAIDELGGTVHTHNETYAHTQTVPRYDRHSNARPPAVWRRRTTSTGAARRGRCGRHPWPPPAGTPAGPPWPPLVRCCWPAPASTLRTTLRGKLRAWDGILNQAALKGDEHVLDMGCGRGAVLIAPAHRLARRHPPTRRSTGRR
jgi:hypothetical protein